MIIRTYTRTDEPCLRGTSSLAGVMVIVRRRKRRCAANQSAKFFLAVDWRAGWKRKHFVTPLSSFEHAEPQVRFSLVLHASRAVADEKNVCFFSLMAASQTGRPYPIISPTTPLNQLNSNKFKHQSRVSTWRRQDSVTSRPTIWPQSPTKRSTQSANSNGRRSSNALYSKIKPVARFQRVCAMQKEHDAALSISQIRFLR